VYYSGNNIHKKQWESHSFWRWGR